mmetsp:Transcript_1016/g.3242  ORF Transcript_1016/g.3242 Transcript_1016/m.3242 type:complete len:213 (-) Transcript_1016:165-803(-)
MHGYVTRRSRARTERALAPRASTLPLVRLQIKLPHVVKVSHLGASCVVKPTKQNRTLTPERHAMATSRTRAVFRRHLFPFVTLSVEPPRVAMVQKALLVWTRKLPTEHVHVRPIRERLVSRPRMRTIWCHHARPFVSIDIVAIHVAAHRALFAFDALASVHHELIGFCTIRRRHRRVSARRRLLTIIVNNNTRSLAMLERQCGEYGVDVVAF